MHPPLKRAVAALVSMAILAAVWLSIDRRELFRTLANAHLGWFAVALLLFIPPKLFQAWRWRTMTRRFCPITTGEALRLILAGDALNLVLPSKLGDLSRALLLRTQGRLPLAHGVNLVAYEKMLDLSSLSLLMVVGVLAIRRFDAVGIAGLTAAAVIIGITTAVSLSPFVARGAWRWLGAQTDRAGAWGKIARLLAGTGEVVGDLVRRGTALSAIVALSLAIWVLHFLQVYCFFLALRLPTPFFVAMALVPLAIFAGLVPFTIGGLGTRDAAFVFLFRPWHSGAAMAGIGLLSHLRYIIPGLVGLPFFSRYLREIQTMHGMEIQKTVRKEGSKGNQED
jgi:hypothetical protein